MHLLLLQVIVAAVTLLLLGALARAERRGVVGRVVAQLFRRLAGRRGGPVLCGIASLLFNLAATLLIGEPQACVHDEISYLLAADTYAHGRCTNPTHACWEHFETYHVIHQPTYQSKYPPGQGLFLAFGQAALGKPILGVWLSLALASAAICWALQGWMPPRWAALGGLLAALHPGIVISWGQSYWGGGVAMLGGALVFGAGWRVAVQPRVRDALWLGLGLALLANSRPYEGLVASLPVAGLLLASLCKRGMGVYLVRVILPLGILLAIIGTLMSYYNYRVTGSPWELPYQAWVRSYSQSNELSACMFGWTSSTGEARPRGIERISDAPVPPPSTTARKFYVYWRFYFGLVLTLPWLAVSGLLKARWSRFAAGSLLLVLIACAIEGASPQSHYAAPAAVLAFALCVQGLRHLRHWSRGSLSWRGQLATAILTAYFLTGLAVLGYRAAIAPKPDTPLSRADLVRQLEDRGGRHLVLVRHDPSLSPHRDWVHNGADIDAAPVIFARDLGPQRQGPLLEYFADRQVWLLELARDWYRIRPF